MMKTIMVVSQVSFQLGQVTFFISRRTCWKNSIGADAARGRGRFRVRCHTPIFLSPQPFQLFLNLAGVEGLEPTALGFGDRCSTS